MKKVVYAFAVIGLVVLGWLWYSAREVHKHILVDDVSGIRMRGGSVATKLASWEETHNIVKWYNSAGDVRVNKGVAGTTPEAGIYIDLKSGKTISILRSGTDFEVQTDTFIGRTSYWEKQAELRELLDRLAGH